MRTAPQGAQDVCTLPGCGEVIEQAAGRPKRLYCSAAHRATARRLRSRSVAGTLELEVGPPADEPASTADQQPEKAQVRDTGRDEHPATQPVRWQDVELSASLPWPPVAPVDRMAVETEPAPRQRTRAPRQRTPRQRTATAAESIDTDSIDTDSIDTDSVPTGSFPTDVTPTGLAVTELPQDEQADDKQAESEPAAIALVDSELVDDERTRTEPADNWPARAEPAPVEWGVSHDELLLDQPWLAADRLADHPRPQRQRVVFHLPRKVSSRPAGHEADDGGRRGVGGRIRPIGHRQRATVVLATALVLLGGSAWAGTTSTRTEHGVGDPVAPVPDAAQWVQHAEGTLTLVSQQLDLIAQAEEAWNRQPTARRSGPPPPALSQLRNTKTQLELQRTVLQDQVSAVHSLPDVKAQLVSLEQQVADVNAQLDAGPTPGGRAAEHAATANHLVGQRDMWIGQLGAKREELERLQAGVHSAVSSPLPTVPDLVAPTVESVLELVDPNSPKDPGGSDRDPPVATAPRAEGNARPKDEVGVGAPPNPLGVGLGEATKDVADTAKDATKAVADTAKDATKAVADTAADTTKSVADTTKGVADTGRGVVDSARSALPVGGSASVADRGAGVGSTPAIGTGSPMRAGLSQAMRIADRFGMGDEVSSAVASNLTEAKTASGAAESPDAGGSATAADDGATALRSRVSRAALSAAESEVDSALADDAMSADGEESGSTGGSAALRSRVASAAMDEAEAEVQSAVDSELADSEVADSEVAGSETAESGDSSDESSVEESSEGSRSEVEE